MVFDKSIRILKAFGGNLSFNFAFEAAQEPAVSRASAAR